MMDNQFGRAYAVGVGPGDPELMTLKAVRIIGRCSAVAFPAEKEADSLAFRIAAAAVSLEGKRRIALTMPMTRDEEEVRACHLRAAEAVAQALRAGEDVALLTLGDPTIYSTALYVLALLKERGFETEIIPGVPSFAAASARAGIPLALGNEAIHILPGAGDAAAALELPGTKVFMKSGRGIARLREALQARDAAITVHSVSRCTMEGERIGEGIESLNDAPYFTVVIVKATDEK